MNCPICKTERQAQGRCCGQEISRLKRKVESQSRLIEKLESAPSRRSRRPTDEIPVGYAFTIPEDPHQEVPND